MGGKGGVASKTGWGWSNNAAASSWKQVEAESPSRRPTGPVLGQRGVNVTKCWEAELRANVPLNRSGGAKCCGSRRGNTGASRIYT